MSEPYSADIAFRWPGPAAGRHQRLDDEIGSPL